MDDLRRVVYRRINLFFVYSVLFQAALVLALTISDFYILHPLVWLKSAFFKVTSLSSWLYFCTLIAFLVALCGVMQKRFLEGPYLYTSRFMKIKKLFSMRSARDGSVYAIVSAMISCVSLAFLGGEYSSLYKKCTRETDTPGSCVVEEKVYLLFNALWSGMFYFASNFMHNSSFPVFPLIQQFKFIRLKVLIFPSLRTAMGRSVWPCVTFPIIYLWFGDLVLGIVCDLFALHVEKPLFETIFDVLNFKLIFISWLLTSIFVFTLTVIEHILNIVLTESCEFPVSAQYGVKTTLLNEVLSPNQSLLIKNWGYFDLLQIAKADYARRQELFTLSQPGGHPKNWNAITKECLELITRFSENLSKELTETSIKVHESSKQSQPLPPPSAIQRPYDGHSSMRNLSMSQFESMTFQYEHSVTEVQSFAWNQVLLSVDTYLTRLKSSLMKKPGFHYIFGRIPDAELKILFTTSLPVINAIQSLAFLISASVTEDLYGVVQKDLDTVLTTLLELKIIVDKAVKIGNVKRMHKNEIDFQMKFALKAALSRSIYKLCIVFREHLLLLNINPNAYLVLQTFITPHLE